MNSREFKERYLFDPQRDLIAEGTFSRVFRATDALLQRDICIKLFRKELIAGSPLIRELSRAGVFFHPNICAFYDLVEIEESNVLGEVEIQPIGIMEHMNGGVITDYLAHHGQDPELIKKFIKDIIRGLSYLHSIGKPHLDIKPGNLLIKLTSKEPVAKITDFLNSENLHTRAVPIAIDPQLLCYRAPECFDSRYGELAFKADIWSLGIMVYELASGKKLFWNEGDSVEKTIRNICYTDYWAQVHELPEPFMAFVKKCLIRDTADRNVSLEELTLTLDGYQSGERTAAPVSAAPSVQAPPVAPPVASPVVEKAPLVLPVVEKAPVAAPIVEKTPVKNEKAAGPKAAPAAMRPEARAGDEKNESLSMAFIVGSLLLLAGVGAFIWRVATDHDLNLTNPMAAEGRKTEQTVPAPVVKKIDTSGIMAEARPRVIHDTVKVVQIQQVPLIAAFTPPPVRTVHAGETKKSEESDIKVKVMPMLPYFDYLFTDRPYYFDLKTPLMSDEEFDLYCANAAVTALGKNTFYVKPTQAGPLDVMVLDRETHARVAEKVYDVRAKEVPVATLGDDITGGFVSPKMLLAKLTMQAKSDSGKFRVKSFHMTCKSGACDIQDVSDNGTFNESMIRFLKNVKAGEQIYFDNILAEDDKGQTVKLDAFEITTY